MLLSLRARHMDGPVLPRGKLQVPQSTIPVRSVEVVLFRFADCEMQKSLRVRLHDGSETGSLTF